MGAAVIGGVGVGLYPDFSMAEQMNQVAETFPPNPAAQAIYNQLFPIFEATYRALEPIYERMVGLK
jgi:xylulokinase